MSRKELRTFGIGLGIIFLLLTALFIYKYHARAAGSTGLQVFLVVLPTLGVLLLVIGAVAPGVLGPIYKVWTPIAKKIGEFNTRVLLFLVFYLVLGPVAIVRKLLGKDDLRLKYQPKESYFIPKDQTPVTLETCRRQF